MIEGNKKSLIWPRNELGETNLVIELYTEPDTQALPRTKWPIHIPGKEMLKT